MLTGKWEDIYMFLTRGERNNNPGNIRESAGDKTKWVGERATDDDKAFEEFIKPEDGIRALAVTLHTYYTKYALNTVKAIIWRWAPSNENNTHAYIAAVAAQMHVAPDSALNLADVDILVSLVKAIIHHENGRCIYPDPVVQEAVKRAL